MSKAADWNELVVSDDRTGGAKDLVIKSIADLKSARKRLFDGILFDAVGIFRCYSGRYRFTFKDSPTIELKEGEVVVVYPRHVLTIDALEKSNRMVYGQFTGKDVEHYFDSVGFFDCAMGRTDSHYESIMELRRQLESVRNRPERDYERCLSMLTDILRTQLREMRLSGNVLLFDAIHMVHVNLRNRVSSLKMLAASLGVSRVHIHRLFTAAGLGSPSEFIRARQMHIVRDLLENTNLPFSEIAQRTGFLSSSHFSTFVKKFARQTPTHIRRRGQQ